MKRIIILAALGLGACTAAQQQQAAGYQAAISAACSTAMTFDLLVPSIKPWIDGGCGTEQAIAALANDPTSLAWVNGLIAQMKASGA